MLSKKKVLDQEPQVFQKKTESFDQLGTLRELLPVVWQSLANVGACSLACPTACPHLRHAERGGAELNSSSSEAAWCCARAS